MKFVPSYHHARACTYYKIRPRKNSPHPEKTNTRFCHYDAAHKDYVYTPQWAKFLINELREPGKLELILNAKNK